MAGLNKKDIEVKEVQSKPKETDGGLFGDNLDFAGKEAYNLLRPHGV